LVIKTTIHFRFRHLKINYDYVKYNRYVYMSCRMIKYLSTIISDIIHEYFECCHASILLIIRSCTTRGKKREFLKSPVMDIKHFALLKLFYNMLFVSCFLFFIFCFFLLHNRYIDNYISCYVFIFF